MATPRMEIIDFLRNTEDTQVFISSSNVNESSSTLANDETPLAIRGFYDGNLSIGGSASYNPMEGVGSKVSKSIAGKASSALGVGLDQIQQGLTAVDPKFSRVGSNPQFVQGSQAIWDSTEILSLSLTLTFVHLSENPSDAELGFGDVRTQSRKLIGATYPDRKEQSFDVLGNNVDADFFVAPRGYKRIEFSDNSQGPLLKAIPGAVSVQVGTWFLTDKIMLIRSANFTYSKETAIDGSPMFAQGSVELQSARPVVRKEIESYLGAV